MKLFTELAGLERSIGYHLDRQAVLASNVANAETPGYRSRDLDFERYMSRAESIHETDGMHIGDDPADSALMFEPVPPKADDNTVRLERAMAQVSANRVRYEAGATLTRHKLAILRYAATDGANG